MKQEPCFFCQSNSERRLLGNYASLYSVECVVCERYFITGMTHEHSKEHFDDNERWLLNCISENIASNKSNLSPLWMDNRKGHEQITLRDKNCVIRYFGDFKNVPINHGDKPKHILRLFAEKLATKNPFQEISLGLQDLFSIKVNGFEEYRTYSGGNHAVALSYAARRFGTSAKVVMPESANPSRRNLAKLYRKSPSAPSVIFRIGS